MYIGDDRGGDDTAVVVIMTNDGQVIMTIRFVTLASHFPNDSRLYVVPQIHPLHILDI